VKLISSQRHRETSLPAQRAGGEVADPTRGVPPAYIATELVGPVLMVLNGGASISDAEKQGLVTIYSRLLTGFDRHLYAEAARQILLEAKNTFRPAPSVFVEKLKELDDEQPHNVRAREIEAQQAWARRRMYEVWGSIHTLRALNYDRRSRTWKDEDGPAPGQPGCRLPQQLQEEVWHDILAELWGDRLARWKQLKCRNMNIRPGEPECPVPPHILKHFELPSNPEELGTVKAAEEELQRRERERWQQEEQQRKRELAEQVKKEQEARRKREEHAKAEKAVEDARYQAALAAAQENTRRIAEALGMTREQLIANLRQPLR
jgi:hypothetical protein